MVMVIAASKLMPAWRVRQMCGQALDNPKMLACLDEVIKVRISREKRKTAS
ncbi:hypothetical protein [Ammoniphilus oxalaticus]|uniref:hypothetical protein n=1 Tax=Ammoniphilus oxalaticus TaxID=66863 RepID=UPI0014741DF5|nr:hypothetical protein [Ammoniphilus oxalaticus]